MKNERIFNAVGKISDELIEDAAISNQRSKKHFPWKALVASAACFCLLLTAFFSMPHLSPNTPDDTVPGLTNPSSPTSQGNNDKYVPFLSAYDVAGVLTSFADRDGTNAYIPTKVTANLTKDISGSNERTAIIAPKIPYTPSICKMERRFLA